MPAPFAAKSSVSGCARAIPFALPDSQPRCPPEKLLAADYVAVRKETGDGRPQSFYALTPGGLSALQAYVQALHRLLPISRETSDASKFGQPKLAG